MSSEAINLDTVISIVKQLTERAGIDQDIDADTALLSSGLIDSLSIAELQESLEKTCDVRIPLSSFAFDNADTPKQILQLVQNS